LLAQCNILNICAVAKLRTLRVFLSCLVALLRVQNADGMDGQKEHAGWPMTTVKNMALNSNDAVSLVSLASGDVSCNMLRETVDTMTSREAADGRGATIYLRHLQLAVETVMRERADLRELFSEEEKTLVAPFLPEIDEGSRDSPSMKTGDGKREPVLSREARGLYTRMLQRKGPWFRLDSLIKYDELLSDGQKGGPASHSLLFVSSSDSCLTVML